MWGSLIFVAACGISLPDQGLNPGPHVRSAESSPLGHHGNLMGTLLILCHMTQSRLDKSILRSGLASTVPRLERRGLGSGYRRTGAAVPQIWAILGSGVGGAPLARVWAPRETDREGLGEPLTLVVEPLDLADRLDTG